MAQTDRPPFRADHVGSLLRPQEVRQAHEDFENGRIGRERLRDLEDQAVRAVVRRQEEIGLRSTTDGELRRKEWHSDFIDQLQGTGYAEELITVPARNERGEVVVWTTHPRRIEGRVALGETIFGADFRFLRECAGSATPKQTIPSPSMVTFRLSRQAVDATAYPTFDGLYEDVCAAYAEEVRRLADLGCTYLQLDDTTFAFLNDPAMRQGVPGDGERLHETNIRNINRALAGRPDGLTVTVHMCRGNYQSAWFSEGGYDYVAEPLFSELEVDAFFLEYDDERSGTFEPLRFVPKGKRVVLGLVTTKRPTLESKDVLKRRVEDASRYLPLDQLCLSPQCGFASTAEGNRLTEEDQWAKLRLVVETAAEIWG